LLTLLRKLYIAITKTNTKGQTILKENHEINPIQTNDINLGSTSANDSILIEKNIPPLYDSNTSK